MDIIRLKTPLKTQDIRLLHAGDMVELSGEVFAARDQVHKRLCGLLDAGSPMPVNLDGAVIYFTGPTPPRPGRIIGSAGPTTASRMDQFSPKLIANGLKAMIGKGYRNQVVRDALVRYQAVHFSALGGAGALLSRYIVGNEVIAYEDLGPEALRRLELRDFPLIVAYDVYGKSVYESARTSVDGPGK